MTCEHVYKSIGKNICPKCNLPTHEIDWEYQNNLAKQWKIDNIEKSRLARHKAKLKKKYGITLEQYEAMFDEQKGVCYICKNESLNKRLSVDHCHKTGKIRRLLCDKCNMTLGLVNDSQELLKQFIFYLK